MTRHHTFREDGAMSQRAKKYQPNICLYNPDTIMDNEGFDLKLRFARRCHNYINLNFFVIT